MLRKLRSVFSGKIFAYLLFTISAISANELPVHDKKAVIGVLVDLHQSEVKIEKGVKGEHPKATTTCGQLDVHSYQQLEAVKWAVEVINNRSWPEEFAIEISVHDTCSDGGAALSESQKLLTWASTNKEIPLIGTIVIGSRNNERIIDRPLETLNTGNVSAVVTSARAAELLLSKHPNVFTTAPDISSVAEGVVTLVNQLGSTNVAIISSCTHALKEFESIASQKSILMKQSLVLEKDDPKILESVMTFLRDKAEGVETVVLMLESMEMERFVTEGDTTVVDQFLQLKQDKTWILGSVGVDDEFIQDWSMRFQSNLLVMQPHVSANPDFKAYLLDKLTDSFVTQIDADTKEYIELVYDCKFPASKGVITTRPSCRNLNNALLEKKLRSEPNVGFIVSAVSVYSAALRMAQLELCSESSEETSNTPAPCDSSQLSTAISEALKKMNIPLSPGSPAQDADSTVANAHELEGATRRINHEGKLISRKYDLFLSKINGHITRVGQYSTEDGLVLDVMLGMNSLESTTPDATTSTSSWTKSNRASATSRRGKTAKYGIDSQDYLRQRNSDDSIDMRTMMSTPEYYISRVWAMVVTAVAITGVFIALYMLVYVLQRMCDGTLQGNQLFGILLLLGVMMLYSSVVLFVLPPGILLCNLRVFLPSLAATVCFGILLLKAMQLRCLVQLGLGGRVSAINQFITFAFIVAVQLAINIQWFLGSETEVIRRDTGWVTAECSYSFENYLYLHIYLGCLVLVVFLYGTSVLKIRRNYNEAKWITLAAFLTLPIAVTWALVVHMGPSDLQEPAACIAFISTATVLLFSIFIPKLYTISQQGQGIHKKRKKMLQQAGPGYTGSISTIFTTLSDRGTLQSQISQKRGNSHHHPSQHPYSYSFYHNQPSILSTNHQYLPPPPPPTLPTGASGGKSVTYSPRLTTNFYNSSSSAATSLTRSVSMKTPFFDTTRAAYP